ncbi:MAG TPA: hypothetical protein VD967_02445 [Candidatus Paceibacterota bacterium]|nr:hypothetical protein [Candidatus Paceibacterota bacterium]
MQEVSEVHAIAGQGLEGDRYCSGEGSFNKGVTGRRQVTIMDVRFFASTSFAFIQSRRNIFTEGIEIYDFLRRDKDEVFRIGEAVMRGVRYCDPCNRPSKLVGMPNRSFRAEFWEHGGIVAEVIGGGIIKVGDPVIGPHKDYD